MATLLVITIITPLFGAAIVWAFAPLGRQPVRIVALILTLVTLALAGTLIVNYQPDALAEYQWLRSDAGLDVRISLELDGLSLWLFGLSALLMVTCVLVSWEAIREQPALFYVMLLLLEFGCLGVFAARDIILFYVFFEFTLIPLFFLIGIWGSEDRRYAAIKFFLFTLAGSVLTFLGFLAIVLWHANGPNANGITFSISELTNSLNENAMPVELQLWVFLSLFIGFAIKVPLFPLHTWLPLAHVQAPTAGSVFLAGILLKIGTYGFLRFSIPMLPNATATCVPWLLWLSVAGIIYGALVALAQTDIKRLIAYSSVSHLGFCMLGIFALNPLGVEGGTLQMINHGISTGALFALVGMIYERYHTRKIGKLGGLARRTPWLAFFMLFFTFSSIGLPGMNGFAGEFLLLAGMFQRAFQSPIEAPAEGVADLVRQLRIISVIAVLGVVLGAWYMLWLIQRIFFGPLKEPASDEADPPVHDMTWREVAALAPLAIFVVWIGVQPGFFLKPMREDLNEQTRFAQQQLDKKLSEPETDATAMQRRTAKEN